MTDSRWRLEARKYDQRLHYVMPLDLVADDGECLHFHSPPGDPINHLTRGKLFTVVRPAEMYFWRGRWYNIYANHNPDGTLHHYYCNVGLPPEIDVSNNGRTLSFIDLDLDVWLWPDGRHEVLDEDEFSAHTVEFGYPPDVQTLARQAVSDILALWQAGGFPAVS